MKQKRFFFYHLNKNIKKKLLTRKENKQILSIFNNCFVLASKNS